MQNFRKKYAYRVSLCLLLLIPVLISLITFLVWIYKPNGNISSVGYLYSMILFPLSLFLRAYSLDQQKRWLDFGCIFFGLAMWCAVAIFQPNNILDKIKVLIPVSIISGFPVAVWFLVLEIKRKRENLITK